MLKLIEQTATTEIWEADGEFYCYLRANEKLIRVCHSIGMAREVLAGY